MKQFYIVDECHAIDLNELQWVEFCDSGPITNTGEYRVKMLFKGNGPFHMDVSKKEFDKLAAKVRAMGENRIC